MMSRTTRYTLLYGITIVAVAGLVISIVLRTRRPDAWLVIAVVLLLSPSRIAGIAWRDFFRGRRLMRMGRADEAVPFFERFLEQVRRRPSLKHFIWLVWGVYTRDIEVMTLNNLGVIRLGRLELAEAERFFNEAWRLDPQYPFAPYNLAAVRVLQKDTAAAAQLLERSAELGYRRTSVDRLIHQLGGLLAAVEGRPIKEQRS